MKNNLTKKDFENILKNYNIGEYNNSKLFEKGGVQTNYLIQTDKRKYVLRYYTNKRKTKYIYSELNLIKRLYSNNFPCPKPIKNNKGNYLMEYKERNLIVFDYVEREHISVKETSKKQLQEISFYLAKYHNIVKGYKPSNYKEREFHDKSFIKKELNQARKNAKTKNIEIDASIKFIIKKLQEIKIPNNLPKAMIHGDYNASNILFRGEKINAIIDFDDSSYEPMLYDLVDVARNYSFLFLDSFDKEKFKTIIQFYNKKRKLSDIEKKYFYDVFVLRYCLFATWVLAYGVEKANVKNGMSAMLKRLQDFEKNNYHNEIKKFLQTFK